MTDDRNLSDAVDAALRGHGERLAAESKGGFCVPTLFDTGALARGIRLNPNLKAWLAEREALEAARPRREKIARWFRRRRREATWRIGAAWRVLIHGDTDD